MGSARMAELTRELVADTVDEVRANEPEWRQAVETLGSGEIDADPDFLLSTLSVAGEGARPYIALQSRNGAISSAIIGRRVRRRIPFRIGLLRLQSPMLECLDVVHGGYLSDGSSESIEWCIEHLRELLAKRTVDCVTLLHLSEKHPAFTRLNSPVLSGRRPEQTTTDHWTTRLIDPVTRQRIDRYSGKVKRNLKRTDRMLTEHFAESLTIRKFKDPFEVKEFIAAASAIGARSYQAGIDVGVQDTERWHTLTGVLARLGRFRGHLLLGANEPIAYVLSAVYRSTGLLVAMAFVPDYRALSPGTFLLRAVMEDLEQDGVLTVDFGFGDSPTKRLHGNACVREAVIRFYGASVRARVAENFGRLAVSLKRWLDELLRRTDLNARVKRLWRRRMEGRK
jgi:hypothetical protein